MVRFAKADAEGRTLFDENSSTLTLVAHDPVAHVEQAMQWQMPIVYPTGLDGTGLPLPTLLALLAGLLAVLSPCLLQLTVYYTFAVAGMSVQQGMGDLGALRTVEGPPCASDRALIVAGEVAPRR